MKALELQTKDILQRNDAHAFSALLDRMPDPNEWFRHEATSGRPYWIDLITNVKRFKNLYPVLKEKNIRLPTHTGYGIKKETMTTLEKAVHSKNWPLVKELVQAQYPYGNEKRTWEQFTRLICSSMDFEGMGTGKYQLLNQLPQKIDLFNFLVQNNQEMTPSMMGNLLLTHWFLSHHKNKEQFQEPLSRIKSLLEHGREKKISAYVSGETLRTMGKNKDWGQLLARVPDLKVLNHQDIQWRHMFKDYNFIGMYLQLLSFKNIFAEVNPIAVRDLVSSTLSLNHFLNEPHFDHQLLQVTRVACDFPEVSQVFWEITKEWLPNHEKLKEIIQYRADSYKKLYELHSALLRVAPEDKLKEVLDDLSWLNRHAYVAYEKFKHSYHTNSFHVTSGEINESHNPVALSKIVWDTREDGLLNSTMRFWVQALNSISDKDRIETVESRWSLLLQQFQKDHVFKTVATVLGKKEMDMAESLKGLDCIKKSPYASVFMESRGMPAVLNTVHLENIQKVKPLISPPSPSFRF